MAHGYRMSAAVCRCGETSIDLTGEPLQSVTCYCESCRTAAQGFESDLGAPPTVTAAGGVDYCVYRKDRVKVARGAQHLVEHRLKPQSPTRRVVAGCCGSPMFADFTPGHWLTVFRGRVADAPEPRAGLMAKERPPGAVLPAGVRAYDSMPPGMLVTLLGSWAAMGFRRPKIVW